MNEIENTQTDTSIKGSIKRGPFRLPYRIEGNGHPTIVIGPSIYYRRAFSHNLRDHLRLVFIDHRGCVPSPGPVDNAEFELEQLIDDVECLRKELKLGRVAVIGHSGHSFMALEYGKKYPQHTSHVIMIGVSPTFGPDMMEKAEQNWEANATDDRKLAEKENMIKLSDEELSKLTPEQAFIQGYVRNAARIWYDSRYDCTTLWDGVTANMDMFNYVWGEVFANIDVTKGLDTFDRPVFMALGKHDYIVGPPSTWDPIIPHFKSITVKIFEKSGHTPQFEEPELFNQELLDWIAKHS
jgi:proline iminopeptidase